VAILPFQQAGLIHGPGDVVRFSDASPKGAVFLAARWRFLANFLSTPQGVNWQNALFLDGAQPEKLHPSPKRFHGETLRRSVAKTDSLSECGYQGATDFG
jgi:hypothetical protein